MISFIRPALTALLFLLVSLNTFAQSVPTSLFACLDGNGNLYGVTPTGKLGEGCSTGDLPVSLGSAGAVTAGNGLVGNLTNGVLDIGVAEGLSIPPACPPGQIPISDGNGAWICTPPAQLANPNTIGKTWVVTDFRSRSGRAGDRALALNPERFYLRDEIRVINPSLNGITATCYEFTRTGQFVAGARTLRIPSGGFDTCFQGARDRRWSIVVATGSVMVSATGIRPTGSGAAQPVSMFHIPSFPVDCRFPEGYEFVCQWAIAE